MTVYTDQASFWDGCHLRATVATNGIQGDHTARRSWAEVVFADPDSTYALMVHVGGYAPAADTTVGARADFTPLEQARAGAAADPPVGDPAGDPPAAGASEDLPAAAGDPAAGADVTATGLATRSVTELGPDAILALPDDEPADLDAVQDGPAPRAGEQRAAQITIRVRGDAEVLILAEALEWSGRHLRELAGRRSDSYPESP